MALYTILGDLQSNRLQCEVFTEICTRTRVIYLLITHSYWSASFIHRGKKASLTSRGDEITYIPLMLSHLLCVLPDISLQMVVSSTVATQLVKNHQSSTLYIVMHIHAYMVHDDS